MADAAKKSIFEKFKTDETMEETGVWANFGDGIRIKIRRLKSKKSLDARRELDKPIANEIRRGTLSAEEQKDLAIKQVAYGVIADWEGVTNVDGEDIVYTAKNAYELLKALPELADLIIGISVEADNYREQVVADAVKN